LKEIRNKPRSLTLRRAWLNRGGIQGKKKKKDDHPHYEKDRKVVKKESPPQNLEPTRRESLTIGTPFPVYTKATIQLKKRARSNSQLPFKKRQRTEGLKRKKRGRGRKEDK